MDEKSKRLKSPNSTKEGPGLRKRRGSTSKSLKCHLEFISLNIPWRQEWWQLRPERGSTMKIVMGLRQFFFSFLCFHIPLEVGRRQRK